MSKVLLLAGLLVCLSGCGNLKYQSLKDTSVANPPTAPVKVYIQEFPVTSKAGVVPPSVTVTDTDFNNQVSGRPISGLAGVGNAIVTITRTSRIEDLTRTVLRELRGEQVRTYMDWDKVTDLETVRALDNPFLLVPTEAEDADLEISGSALIRSQRVEKKFSQKTTGVEIEVVIKDLKTGKVMTLPTMVTGIQMLFNSKELEEAMAVAVVTSLMQKTLF
jgi:hypothetical protein